jgi:hypothetical protein
MATITYSAQDTRQLLAVPGDNICRTNLMAGDDWATVLTQPQGFPAQSSLIIEMQRLEGCHSSGSQAVRIWGTLANSGQPGDQTAKFIAVALVDTS